MTVPKPGSCDEDEGDDVCPPMINSLPTLGAAKSSIFLAGLEQSATQAVLSAAQIRSIPAKRQIISGGLPATHFFLLDSGQAQYYHLTKEGESVLVAWLVPGDVMGLMALLDSASTYMASAEATSDCELLVWEHSVIRKLVAHHPLLAENSLRLALNYLRNYVERHVGLTTKNAQQRLADTLLSLADQSGKIHPDGIEISATNDQLGALANISRFTASHMLSDWARSRILSKERGRVILHAPEALMID
ncbi:MAG: Crp/Fnr family transcriptional regulator [Terracidiphilus sp.]